MYKRSPGSEHVAEACISSSTLGAWEPVEMEACQNSVSHVSKFGRLQEEVYDCRCTKVDSNLDEPAQLQTWRQNHLNMSRWHGTLQLWTNWTLQCNYFWALHVFGLSPIIKTHKEVGHGFLYTRKGPLHAPAYADPDIGRLLLQDGRPELQKITAIIGVLLSVYSSGLLFPEHHFHDPLPVNNKPATNFLGAGRRLHSGEGTTCVCFSTS